MDRQAAPSAEPHTSRRWVARGLALAFLSGSVFLLMAGTAAALDIDDTLADVTDTVDDVTTVVTDAVAPVVESVTETVEPIVGTVEPIVEEVVETAEPIVEEIVETVDGVTDAVEPIVDETSDTVSDVVDPIVDVVEPVVEDTTDAIGDVTDPIVGGVPPSDDGIVVPPDSGDVDPVLPGSDAGDVPDQSGVTLVFGDADPVPDAVTGVAPVWSWHSSSPGVPTAFGDLAARGGPSSSVVPIKSPLGGGDSGGAFGAAALLAILSLSMRLLLPPTRSSTAPRVPPLRSAALALSVERPG